MKRRFPRAVLAAATAAAIATSANIYSQDAAPNSIAASKAARAEEAAAIAMQQTIALHDAGNLGIIHDIATLPGTVTIEDADGSQTVFNNPYILVGKVGNLLLNRLANQLDGVELAQVAHDDQGNAVIKPFPFDSKFASYKPASDANTGPIVTDAYLTKVQFGDEIMEELVPFYSDGMGPNPTFPGFYVGLRKDVNVTPVPGSFLGQRLIGNTDVSGKGAGIP